MTKKFSHGSSSRRPLQRHSSRAPDSTSADSRRHVSSTRASWTAALRNASARRDEQDSSDRRAARAARRSTSRRPSALSTDPDRDEVASEWLAAFELRTKHRDPAKRRSPRTLALYRDRIETKVLPTLGTIAIDDLKVGDLRQLVDKLSAKLAPSTVTQIVSMTSALMRYALRRSYITHNPVRDLDRDDRPGVARRASRAISRPTRSRRCSRRWATRSARSRRRAPTRGLRICEALGLTLGRRRLRAAANQRSTSARPGRLAAHATKTKSSTAFVPLLPAFERELRAHRSRQASSIFVSCADVAHLHDVAGEAAVASKRAARASQRRRRRRAERRRRRADRPARSSSLVRRCRARLGRDAR